MILIFHLDKGGWMTETSRYSIIKKIKLAVVGCLFCSPSKFRIIN